MNIPSVGDIDSNEEERIGINDVITNFDSNENPVAGKAEDVLPVAVFRVRIYGNHFCNG